MLERMEDKERLVTSKRLEAQAMMSDMEKIPTWPKIHPILKNTMTPAICKKLGIKTPERVL